ncbi:Zn(2)-C6 fungal-type DNA-binding domain protein [Akanthomyces lecanii RCEF 1005]|uniref:Zn(2)-C6 fungal-type DNA-binding domain protein n=1 Tax=Akanthomyces lecanii RCEF 1005 TaxID=1081108 RepID=A0A168I7B7_CORDF|nr:Zn(2)-C6 fungal-type DNA-binding domain protein [Akanthomyces lecanii RCEF 1005]
MPGVPTFRGCDACHRQKKKCDQASPRCARCARLKIPCTGKGQLRYKFKEQGITFALAKTLPSKSSSPKSLSPPASPSNEITRLSGRFASALQIDDPQFDLKCLGDWFARIPNHAGSSELLDNATETFLDAFDDLRSGQQSLKTLSKYGKALTSLTIALQDPQQTKSPYTLCSIFMIMMAQMWASKSAQGYMSHMEAICHILNSTIDEPWNDSFTHSLRYHLIIPVCIESLLNPNITIDGRYLQILKTGVGPYQSLDEEKGQPIESLDLPYLMRFPYLLREPERHRSEMKREYLRMQVECPFVRRRLMDLTNMVKATRKTKAALVRAQIQMGVAYTIQLCFTLVVNAFLSAMDPTNIRLQEEALQYSQEAIWITRISGRQLPIGAGFMPAALFSAWIATDDSQVISSIASTMKEYENYWAEPNYVRQFRAIKERVRQIRDRKLEELRAGGLQGMDVTDFTTTDGLAYTWGLDSLTVDPASLHNGDARSLALEPSRVQEQAQVEYHSWDPSVLQQTRH